MIEAKMRKFFIEQGGIPFGEVGDPEGARSWRPDFGFFVERKLSFLNDKIKVL